MTFQTMQSRFDTACAGLPAPGTGCHAALLGAANYGVREGLTDAEMLARLHAAVKPGARQVSDREIVSTIQKARRDIPTAPTWPGRHTPGVHVGKLQMKPVITRAPVRMDAAAVVARQGRVIKAGGDPFDPMQDIPRAAEGSNPAWNDWAFPSPPADVLTFLSALYDPDDLIYIGPQLIRRENQRRFIRRVSQWLDFFAARLDDGTDPAKLGMQFPLIVANPLNGKPLESGSWRSDANVSRFRYAVIEHDILPLNQQVPLLRGLGLPIVSMVFSGSKSIHALLDVTAYAGEVITTAERWRQVIVEGLFKKWLAPYQFDTATCNPSRLTRLPGVVREKAVGIPSARPMPELTLTTPPTIPASNVVIPEASPPADRWQRLLYVNAKGGGSHE